MQIIEILRTCGDFLQTLHQFGIKIDDYRYLDMYSDYEKMHKKGHKMTYIVAVIAPQVAVATITKAIAWVTSMVGKTRKTISMKKKWISVVVVTAVDDTCKY